MALTTFTRPTDTPVSVAEAKLNTRVLNDLEDARILSEIKACTLRLEHETGIRVCAQVVDQVLDCFPATDLSLGTWPVRSIVSISYVDAVGATQVVPTASYALDPVSKPCFVLLTPNASWPSSHGANSVRVRFNAGFLTPADVEDDIKSWIHACLFTWYENRGVYVPSAMDRIARHLDAYRYSAL